jgi:hypothetical protein
MICMYKSNNKLTLENLNGSHIFGNTLHNANYFIKETYVVV